MKKRTLAGGDRRLQDAVESFKEALDMRIALLLDLREGRATRVEYQRACEQERLTWEELERVSNGYYDGWYSRVCRTGLESVGWMMGRIRRSVTLDITMKEIERQIS